MSSRKRPRRRHYGLRKKARVQLGDITNSEFDHQAAEPIPSGPCPVSFTNSCVNQSVPENELPPEGIETSMFCSENFNFLPFRRKQPFPKRCIPKLTPGGLLSSLPTEVLHKLLSLLDMESLLSLCLSSTAIVSYIRGYVYTRAGLSHILPPHATSIANSVSKKKFHSLGEFEH